MTKEDLELFNTISEALFLSETKQPVTQSLSYPALFDNLDLELQDDPLSDGDFVSAISGLVTNTPKTSTAAFFNQLFGGRNGKAVIGEMLAALLNNSMYTYKVAGPMIAIEKTIINHIKEKIGFPSSAEGTIASGGSMTNFMALLMARDRADITATTSGVKSGLIVYTSEASHYSISKNASFAGIGKNNVRYIGTNELGQMEVSALINQIEKDKSQGLQPCFVNATSGTTVLGAFDPLDEIGKYCNQKGIWLHVDGAYGGSVLFSTKYRHLIQGVELADSFSFNAHKMMGVPLTCSFLITKYKKALYDSFNNNASYLYQSAVDEINPGKISLQCGRRNDALKFWTLWKAVGTSGLETMVDHQFYLAQVARAYILSNSNYTLYNSGPSVNVCFNYKNIPADLLCSKLHESSEIMVGHGSFDQTCFVRFVTVNANNTEVDILNFFKKLEKFANSYF